jgi:hypothetical protein
VKFLKPRRPYSPENVIEADMLSEKQAEGEHEPVTLAWLLDGEKT